MGLMAPIALKAAEMLEAEGISAAVVNMHTVKPIDAETILAMNEKCKGIVTAEEHSVIGGLGSAVAEVLQDMPELNSKELVSRINSENPVNQLNCLQLMDLQLRTSLKNAKQH